jgi:hypothetical protein
VQIDQEQCAFKLKNQVEVSEQDNDMIKLFAEPLIVYGFGD